MNGSSFTKGSSQLLRKVEVIEKHGNTEVGYKQDMEDKLSSQLNNQ